jgi:hypothetical protein
MEFRIQIVPTDIIPKSSSELTADESFELCKLLIPKIKDTQHKVELIKQLYPDIDTKIWDWYIGNGRKASTDKFTDYLRDKE